MPKGRISFKLSNRLTELKTLNEKIDKFGAKTGIPHKCIFEILLVLEELFTNITCHGYRDNKDHWVHVTISCENDMMTIQVEDDGIPFNPLDFKKPNIKCAVEDREIGGLGIHLVKHFIKDCVYERRGEKNILTLKKTI